MAEQTLKRKVTVKLTYTEASPQRPTSRANISRPTSPVKFQLPARAKINSSAQIGAARKPPSTSSRPGTSEGPTPRAASPVKPPPRIKPGTLSPTFQPRARATVSSSLKPSTTRSNPATPESRHRSQTEVRRGTPESRVRNGSVSLHHVASLSSIHGSNLSSGSSYSPADQAAHSDNEGRYSPSPPVRIKSKVTGMVKPSIESLSPPQTHPTARAGAPRTRAPSISSNVSTSSQAPIFYPITTASPAANPHRYAPRSPPQTAHRYYQPFQQPRDDSKVTYTRQNGVARVDPAAIPLPAPNSPPASAVSLSSRSSLSRSSVSFTAESAESGPASAVSVGPSQNGAIADGDRLRSTLDNLLLYTEMSGKEDSYSGDSGHDRETDGEPGSEARKVKAVAKSNRKIADLEITNRSLLAINASLESAKHKQAKEIRELRRKLRESRLILPPRAYLAVKDHHDTAEEEDDGDDEDNDEELDNDYKDHDEVYKRIKVILEGLIETGKRALERKPEDFPEGAKGGAKVLSADEVRSWRDSGGRGDEATKRSAAAEDDDVPLSPSRIAVPDSDGSFVSEDEVEMTLTISSMPPSPSPGPPISITDSH